jgi:hypothetical protein
MTQHVADLICAAGIPSSAKRSGWRRLIKMVMHPPGDCSRPAGKPDMAFFLAGRCEQPAIDPLKLHGANPAANMRRDSPEPALSYSVVPRFSVVNKMARLNDLPDCCHPGIFDYSEKAA